MTKLEPSKDTSLGGRATMVDKATGRVYPIERWWIEDGELHAILEDSGQHIILTGVYPVSQEWSDMTTPGEPVIVSATLHYDKIKQMEGRPDNES